MNLACNPRTELLASGHAEKSEHAHARAERPTLTRRLSEAALRKRLGTQIKFAPTLRTLDNRPVRRRRTSATSESHRSSKLTVLRLHALHPTIEECSDEESGPEENDMLVMKSIHEELPTLEKTHESQGCIVAEANEHPLDKLKHEEGT